MLFFKHIYTKPDTSARFLHIILSVAPPTKGNPPKEF